MRKYAVLVFLFLWGTPLLGHAASVNLTAPTYLPINMPCGLLFPRGAG